MDSYNQYPGNTQGTNSQPQQGGTPATPPPLPQSTNPAPYYGAGAQWQQPQPTYQQPQQATGWNQPPVPPHPPVHPQKPQKSNGGKVLGAIAVVVASGIVGFAGGVVGSNVGASSPVSPPQTTTSQQIAGNPRPGQTESFSIREVAYRAGQSVVSITTENLVSDPFFGGRVTSGAGSGVVYSTDGYIITNDHVVEGAKNILVTLPDGSEYSAKLIGSDPESDIAVVKIEAENLTAAVVGNSDMLEVGDFVLAIGNPMGTLSGTVTDGIISATNRAVTVGNASMNLVQMSAAVSPGNSGGGLFDANGELIGIVNAKSGGEGAEGLGFAIPINHATDISKQLIENGKVLGRPSIGIMSGNVGNIMGNEGKTGVFVQQVIPGSGAEQAGMKQGDIIIEAGGQKIETKEDLVAVLATKKAGETLPLVVVRGKKNINIEVLLQDKSNLDA